MAHVGRENGVDNVWVQPLDGPTGHQITDFKSEQFLASNRLEGGYAGAGVKSLFTTTGPSPD